MMTTVAAPQRRLNGRKGSTMSMFDNLKDQALKAAREHQDVVESAVEQAAEKLGDAVDAATGGRFAAQVDMVQEQAPEQVTKLLGT
jgi:4-alpha-glucanotransferase